MAQFAAAGAEEIYVVEEADILLDEDRQQMTLKVGGSDFTVWVKNISGHDNHFHVRFPGNYRPVGDIEFSPSSLALPKGDNTEVTITTSIIRDTNGFALFKGYPIYVSVLDADGNPRGWLKEKHRNNSYLTDENGRLTIKYQASGSVGEAYLQLWSDSGRKIPLGKPLPITFTAN